MDKTYPRLQWQDSWRIGIDTIDRQHQRLIGLVNIFFEAMEMKRCPDMYKSVLSGLMSYVHTHFRDEEIEMQRLGYPGLDEQKRLHEELKQSVQHIVDTVRAGGDIDRDAVAAFLYQWANTHLAVEDAKIGQFIKEKQQMVYQTAK